MNKKIILLNLALVALAGVCVYQLRVKRREAAAHEQKVLNRAPNPPQVAPPPPAAPVRPPLPSEYVDVAQRTLFAKDRNPNVVVQAPPPPPPPPPMPPLPAYTGQMSLGEPVIFLSLQGEQKSYHAGDQIGPFTVVAFDRDTVTFDWQGKTVERSVNELRPKEVVQPVAPAAPAAAAAANANAQAANNQAGRGGSSTITSLAPSSANLETKQDSKGPSFGNDMGGGFRGCAPTDTSPAGTVFNGYRKVVSQGLMGTSCHWEQVK